MGIINFILRVIDNPLFLRFGVPVVLLLAVLTGFFWGQPKKPKVKPFAMLEKIQYVHELDLVSYRYDEMILLGVPPKFERKNQELEDLKKLRLQLVDSLRADSARAQQQMQVQAFANERFFNWRKQEDSLRNAVKQIKKKKRKSEAFALWKAAQDSVKASEKEAKTAKDQRQDLEKLVERTRKSLEKLDDQIDRLQKNWDAAQKLDEAEALVIAPVEVSAFVDLRQARFIFSDGGKAARLSTIQDSLKDEHYILSQEYLDALEGAKKSLRENITRLPISGFRTRSGDTLETVDSVSIDTASIDLAFENELQYQLDSIGLLPNRRLVVWVPFPQLNEPVVDLDTTRTVNLARSLTPSIYRNYFEVFEALADEVREIKLDVKDKAIRTGILKEAEEVAETYILSFIASLPQYQAYEVKVVFAAPETIEREAIRAKLNGE